MTLKIFYSYILVSFVYLGINNIIENITKILIFRVIFICILYCIIKGDKKIRLTWSCLEYSQYSLVQYSLEVKYNKYLY